MSAIVEMAIRGCTSDKKKGGKKVTVVGCVVENEGHIVMTDKEYPGGVVLMSSGDIDIKIYIGRMMRVTGIMTTMGDEGTVKVGPDEMMGIKVQSMKTTKGICDMNR